MCLKRFCHRYVVNQICGESIGAGGLGYIRAMADPAGGDVVHRRFLMEEGFAIFK